MSLYWSFLFLLLRAKEKENFTKKKKKRYFSTSSFQSAVYECSAMPNLFSLANLHFVLQTKLGKIKFRAYWREQSMLVRQQQGKHCLTVGSLLALGRTLQLISERKSSSERFFVQLFCRYKKVAGWRNYLLFLTK